MRAVRESRAGGRSLVTLDAAFAVGRIRASTCSALAEIAVPQATVDLVVVAATAARGCRCAARWPTEPAARQDAFWEMHDALFADQGRLEDPHLWPRAERLGLDERCEADRRSDAVRDGVRDDFLCWGEGGGGDAAGALRGGRAAHKPARPRRSRAPDSAAFVGHLAGPGRRRGRALFGLHDHRGDHDRGGDQAGGDQER